MTLDAEYFAKLYAKREDPWLLAERWYESRKRALTVAALPRERYASGLEIGCSVGTLTEILAARCDDLLAVDVAESAVETTRQRLSGQRHVSVQLRDVSREWPSGKHDLIVLSEVGYYFDAPTLRSISERVEGSLADDGVVVTCHWRHPVSDYPLSGDVSREIIRETSGLSLLAVYLDDDFGLEVLARPEHGSVAAIEGLATDG